ncbi:MAG TPA: hypothetical protein VGG61_03135, partial [Gemmataceae bacterium]
AHDMWKKHGERDKLYLTQREIANLDAESVYYRQEYNLQTFSAPVPLDFAREERRTAEDQERMSKSVHAYLFLYWYNHYRTMTNFEHFYLRSQVEADEKTIAARKSFFEGRRLNRQGKRLEALEKYEAPEALAYWRDLLVNERFGSDPEVDDYSYQVQLRYLRLLQDTKGRDFKQAGAIHAFLGQAAASVAPNWIALQPLFGPHLTPLPEITGPFDGNTKSGSAIISADTRNSVNKRFGIGVSPQASPARLPPPSPTAPPG